MRIRRGSFAPIDPVDDGQRIPNPAHDEKYAGILFRVCNTQTVTSSRQCPFVFYCQYIPDRCGHPRDCGNSGNLLQGIQFLAQSVVRNKALRTRQTKNVASRKKKLAIYRSVAQSNASISKT